MRQWWCKGERGMRAIALAAGLACVAACSPSRPPEQSLPMTLGDNAVNTGPLVRNAEPQPQPEDDLASTRWPPRT